MSAAHPFLFFSSLSDVYFMNTVHNHNHNTHTHTLNRVDHIKEWLREMVPLDFCVLYI
ncbi:hypothetical protein Fmac_004375 [Flemingia macrophylla]|uniref:Uncharacterized protein n=1 Tax=Flemingia macrophylla TaxID=520843 RepID=A0ABD1N4X5_9FABA